MTPTRHTRQLDDLRRRLHSTRADSGQATTEILMYGAVIVGVVVIIGAALQALGVDIVEKISNALGV